MTPVRRLELRICFVVFSLSGVAGCDRSADPVGDAPPKDMRAILVEMATNPDPVRNRFANSAMVEVLRGLPPRANPSEQLLFRLAFAEHLLYADRREEAISVLEQLLADLDRYQSEAPLEGRAPPMFRRSILDFLGIAHLKRFSAEACVDSSDSAACSLSPDAPATGDAAEAALRAGELYETILETEPDHLGARWLLNLAHVMAGTYPDGVPARYRIPADGWLDTGDFPRFTDVAPEAGLDRLGRVGGAVVDDFDGDGLLDVLATSWGLTDPVRYHRNRGDGTFEDRTGRDGLEGLFGGGNLVQADYDNDGDLDAFVLRGGWLPDGQPNSLLENLGEGTFRDATSEAGLLEPWSPSQTAAWADYDGDGLLDLLVGNETFGEVPYPVQLFRNLGDGSFEDVAAAVGVAVQGVVKGVAWGDVDNDGRPDAYLSRTGAPNVLLWNAGPGPDGSWRFEDRTESAGVAEPRDAFPTWFWDYDNDGWQDIFVAGYRTDFGDVAAEALGREHGSELSRLYRNLGDGTFEDVTREVGLDRLLFTMGSNFGDLDNDGWLDHYQGTGDPNLQALMPNRMFRSIEGRRFEEVTVAGGFGLLEKGHGVAFADLDHDGDQDVFTVMGGAYEGDRARNVLFRNPGLGGSWIALTLVGTESNRSAIGTRIRLVVDGAEGRREIHRTVSSGSSFGGNPLRVEVGLGGAERIVEAVMTWPTSGIVDRLEGVSPNAAYRVVEGSGAADRLDRPTFSLGGGP